MARRADHTRDELKELAIVAGLEIIKNEGFNHFSARKVASRIGYTVGTLYNVFGSYDDLLLHINARTLDEWYGFMRKRLGAGKARPLQALARAYIEYSRKHYHQWIALFEHHGEDRKLPDWYELKMSRFFTLIEELLMPELGGDSKAAHRAARVLWAGIHGICVLSLSGKLDSSGTSDSPESLARSLIEKYLSK